MDSYRFNSKTINNDLESFQNGVDTIVDGCTTYGSTPTNNTPSKIVESIKAIYENRYNTGYNDGKSKGEYVIAGVIAGTYAGGSSAQSCSFTSDPNFCTASTGTQNNGTLNIKKAFEGKIYTLSTQRGSSNSAVIYLNGTSIHNTSAYSNGYIMDITLAVNDTLGISCSRPDTTFASFGVIVVGNYV